MRAITIVGLVLILSLGALFSCFVIRYGWSETSPIINQAHFRWYKDDFAESPTPLANEDFGWSNINSSGYRLRLRIGVNVTQAVLSGWQFKLQYANHSSGGSWGDVGGTGSSEIWRYFDGRGIDTQQIGVLNLSTSTVKEHFVESAPTASMISIPMGGQGEWDFAIETNNAPMGEYYYFRMVKSDGTLFTDYSQYPMATDIGGGVVYYALIITASSGGTTSPELGTHWYESGTHVSVLATPVDPEGGSEFSQWELDGYFYQTNNPTSVTMNGAHYLHATFVSSVGGAQDPVDKISIVAPYITVAATMGATTVAIIAIGHRKYRKNRQVS